MGTLEVVAIPVLADNYAWLMHDHNSGATAIVDPGEAAPVLAAAAARGWRIEEVWITHWHPDHTGGIADLRAATPVRVTAPAAEKAKIPAADRYVADGDRIALGAHEAAVIAVPGHTAGHIAFHFADDRLLFTGDTLFAMGCGKLMEGSPAQMFASLRRFAGMPDATQVFAGHEYTLANARFARTVEPDNAALAERLAITERQRAASQATLPTTLGLERATNPFVRAGSVAELASRRAAKDRFAG